MLTSSSAASLAIRNVEPSGQMGSYLVSGEATSLDGATLSVAAMRSFGAGSGVTETYALLDRQLSPVSNGEWQVTLQIWRSDGLASPQEPWQINQATLDTALAPSSEVTFVATLGPVNSRNSRSSAALAETSEAAWQTADGEKYLAARTGVNIPAPATLSADALKEANSAIRISDRQPAVTVTPTRGTAGDLSQSAAASRTTMPLSPKHYLK
ncbi:MAG: hypothetical protein ACFB5Z_05445 [Elainellaceae cyanobacterium]